VGPEVERGVLTDLGRYCQSAEIALRAAAAAHEESDADTLQERLEVLGILATHEDLLRECADLNVDLPEVVSAIAYARLIGRAAKGRKDPGNAERERRLGRIRVAMLRAKRRRDRARMRSLESIRTMLERPEQPDPVLWAHAALYQYVVRCHRYRAARRMHRARLDGLIAWLLGAFAFCSTSDYQALRRHRRLLIAGRGSRRGRPRLFLHKM
jgi:hypothetical protein